MELTWSAAKKRLDEVAGCLFRLHKQEIESIRAISMEIGKNQGLSMAEECSAQLRHSMREQLLDKQNELHEAQKGTMREVSP